MTTPHISIVREHLLNTLADLRNRDTPMETDRARAVAQVATVLVDTAKVEIEYLKATGQDCAPFLEAPTTAEKVANELEKPPLLRGLAPSVVHRLKG